MKLVGSSARRLVNSKGWGVVFPPMGRLLTSVLLLWMSACGGALAEERLAAHEPEPKEDWPVLISQLQQQHTRWPAQANTRRQLALAYNNYGVQLGERARWGEAVQQLDEALRLNADDEQFKTNLAAIYLNWAYDAYTNHQTAVAAEAIAKAIAITPNAPQAYRLLGEIEYDRQRLKEAKVAWQRGLELDPHNAQLADRLTQVTKELPVESKFERLSQTYFDIRYEERTEVSSGFDLRSALIEARRAVGGDFAYWPKHKLVVLIYGAESFRALKQETPDWVAGQFDGKIRVPLPSAGLDDAGVRQILFHEYTHAVIYDLTQGRCPTWLNEGLAEYEGRSQRHPPLTHLARALAQQRLTPMATLSEEFSTNASAEQAALAYEQAYSLAAYLVTRYGFWRIRRVLKAAAEHQSWDDIVRHELHSTPARFEKDWLHGLPEWLHRA